MAKAGESSIVSKCAQLMDIISAARQPLAFSEVVARSGFVKSSCHRILAVLLAEEMIAYDSDGRTYSSGPRLSRWAKLALYRADLPEAAAAVMDALSEETRMNTALSILDGNSILYLRTSDPVPMRYASRAGDHAPIHSTAAGKVLLAHTGANRRAEILANLRFETFTEFTKTSADALSAELADVVAQGYARALREEYLQVMGLSAPVRNAQDQVIAALSLWTLTTDNTAAQLEAQAPMVTEAADRVSGNLGWQGRHIQPSL